MASRRNLDRTVNDMYNEPSVLPFTSAPLPYPPPGALVRGPALTNTFLGVQHYDSQPTRLMQRDGGKHQHGNTSRRHGYHERPSGPELAAVTTSGHSPFKSCVSLNAHHETRRNDIWTSPTLQRSIRGHCSNGYHPSLAIDRMPFADKLGRNQNLLLPSPTLHTRAKAVSMHVKDVAHRANTHEDRPTSSYRQAPAPVSPLSSSKTKHRAVHYVYEPEPASHAPLRVNLQANSTSSYIRPSPYSHSGRHHKYARSESNTPSSSQSQSRSQSAELGHMSPLPINAPLPRAPINKCVAVFEDALSIPDFEDDDHEMEFDLYDEHEHKGEPTSSGTVGLGLGIELNMVHFTPRKPSVSLLTSPAEIVTRAASPALSESWRGDGQVVGLGLVLE
ncbi:hypothetical protein CI109_105107 [Kwoniella shandongensis]|uniref:Uncharacterized protein n=1 Tax=Kwoniella shandongensis TaxID=1734106 RepID=A0A5M6C401_9TREE|nr:uncharacterized protein CI109_001946 [Kwoniella shandongensis]KAA5529521.1 hypothetical protein CI109_001946 [Kwoniella shandongensis]